jgi:hypothetical protein
MCKCVNLLASLEVEIMKCPLTNATSCAEKYSKAEKFKISNRNMKFIESKSRGGRPNRHRSFTINKVEGPAEVEKRLIQQRDKAAKAVRQLSHLDDKTLQATLKQLRQAQSEDDIKAAIDQAKSLDQKAAIQSQARQHQQNLSQLQTSLDRTHAALKAWKKPHGQCTVKALGEANIVIRYFATADGITPKQYRWLVPEVLEIPEHVAGHLMLVPGCDDDEQVAVIAYVRHDKIREYSNGKIVPAVKMLKFLDDHATTQQQSAIAAHERKITATYATKPKSGPKRRPKIRRLLKFSIESKIEFLKNRNNSSNCQMPRSHHAELVPLESFELYTNTLKGQPKLAVGLLALWICWQKTLGM